MKKIILFLTLCLMSSYALSQNMSHLFGVQIQWTVEPVNPIGNGLPLPKSPVQPPIASIDGHTLYLYDVDYDLTLYLLDEDGDTVYSVVVPVGTPTVILPATLTGDFILQLYPGGNYYFEGEITL